MSLMKNGGSWMKFKNRIIGNRGENVAKKYLLNQGYNILDKNYTCNIGEIDIIAEKEGLIVFIEVKSRNSLNFGYPYEAVDRKKQIKLIKVAQNYINYKRIRNTQFRFDIIEVYLKQSNRVNHIKDAFWA